LWASHAIHVCTKSLLANEIIGKSYSTGSMRGALRRIRCRDAFCCHPFPAPVAAPAAAEATPETAPQVLLLQKLKILILWIVALV
jgi:hypothetical protein